METLTAIGTLLAAVGTIATGAIIFWQARLLRIQNQISALLTLYSVWDSERMLFARAKWASDERDIASAEVILEFLEEFAGLGTRRVLKNELIWDATVGWYAARYYESGSLGSLRAKWLDETLYQNLQELWRRYLRVEGKELTCPQVIYHP